MEMLRCERFHFSFKIEVNVSQTIGSSASAFAKVTFSTILVAVLCVLSTGRDVIGLKVSSAHPARYILFLRTWCQACVPVVWGRKLVFVPRTRAHTHPVDCELCCRSVIIVM